MLQNNVRVKSDGTKAIRSRQPFTSRVIIKKKTKNFETTVNMPLVLKYLRSLQSIGRTGVYFFNNESAKQLCVTQKREAHVIDLRSDTVTQPTPEMRRAMAEAVVGDDVFGEDPTVIELQTRVAVLLGKENSLFVSSGTMANLIAVLVHCNERSSEILLGDKSHLHLSEQGCIAQIASTHHRTLRNKPDGTWDLQEMEEKIRGERAQEPVSKLVCVENTHCMCGGKVLPMAWVDEVTSFCRHWGLLSHLDGARLCNAAVHLNIPEAKIAKDFDSVSICLSKNLSAPVGSVLAGNRDFIKKAIRARKALGGGMRQAGVLAAAGLVALDMKDRLSEDHDHAALIAKGIAEMEYPGVHVESSVDTNIVILTFDCTLVTPKAFCDRLAQVKPYEVEKIGKEVKIKMNPISKTKARLVTHHDIKTQCALNAREKLQLVIKEFEMRGS